MRVLRGGNFGGRFGAAGERDRPVGRQALDRERAGQPHLVLVGVGLVVEGLGIGVETDRRVDLVVGYALDDVGVVLDRLQGDVRDLLIDEPLADAPDEPRAA